MAQNLTRQIAGVALPNTPVVIKALAYARSHSDDMTYNHVLRSCLFGFVIADKSPDLRDRDREVHAVAAILHDLGWDNTGELVSEDKRFEVDGAIAARAFLDHEAKEWDHRRKQLVWDAIALHTTQSIAMHKEAEVVATTRGIMADFGGPDNVPGGLLTWDEYREIVKALPRIGLVAGCREIFCNLCRTKPVTTYDNIVSQWGEKYVEGYTLDGHRAIDGMESYKLDDWP